MIKPKKAKAKAKNLKGGTDVLPQLQRIIAHQLKNSPERVTPESHMQRDLGADSLDALEIVCQIEEEFDIQIPEEDARRMGTVQDIMDYLTNRMATNKKK